MYGNGGKLEFEIRERNGVARLFSRSISSRKNCRSIRFTFFCEFGSCSNPLFYESRAFGDRVELGRAVVWKRKSWIIQNLLAKVGRRGGVDESDDGVGGGRGSRKRGGLCCQGAYWRKQCWSAAGNHGSRAQVRHLVKLLIIIVFLVFFFFLVVTVVLFLRAFGIGVFSYLSPSSSSSSSSSSPSHIFFLSVLGFSPPPPPPHHHHHHFHILLLLLRRPSFVFGIRSFSSSSSLSSSSSSLWSSYFVSRVRSRSLEVCTGGKNRYRYEFPSFLQPLPDSLYLIWLRIWQTVFHWQL